MIIAVLILLGLCFGSFVNALVWRLHEQAKLAKSKSKNTKESQALSLMRGRSMCVHCHHELAAKDLVPVLSWLSLHGKCRYCHKSIAWQYPLVELLTTLLFAASYLAWPRQLQGAEWLMFALWLVLVVGFIALIVYDLRWMLLPNRLIFPLFIPALLSVLLRAYIDSGFQPILSAGLGVLVGGGIFYLIFQVSAGKWIGGGDVKLGFLLGLVLGSGPKAFLLLFVASLLGTLCILPLLATKRISHTSRIPFGPFLVAGAVVVELWGQRLLDWYLGTAL
jgi:prepilin signal peptidase PulO-like enzyme (type II secretory pathway)